MIMPINAAPYQAKQNFKCKITVSKPMEEAIQGFTVAEKQRWGNIKNTAENTNDKLLYEICQNIRKIGAAIIKSVVIKNNTGEILKEDVYSFSKGGSVYLLNRETIARTIIDTFENIYKK